MTANDIIAIIGAISTPVLAIVAMVMRAKHRDSAKLNSVMVGEMQKVIDSAPEIEAEDIKKSISHTAEIEDASVLLALILAQKEKDRKAGKL